jgi:hypothetical protein
MSVLKLRRDMVVADDKPAAGPAPMAAVEISTPLPLRTIPASSSRQVVLKAAPAEIIEPANDRRRPKRAKPRKTFLAKLKGWTTLAAALALIAAYPVMTLMASDVGDKVAPPVDHTQWTVAWAGGASQMMDAQYGPLGWAKDAPTWAPMARLTAKPAYQQALAGALGDFASLKMAETGAADPDLAAAGRLLSVASTGVQVRAARDALVNYDRRARRRGVAAEANPAHIAGELKLVLGWAATSQGEIAGAAERKGNPIDHDATVAVYAAKGRAMVAHLVLETMQWPGSREAETARTAALAAWKQAAEFHPILVLNGNPDGSIFGNHPTSMGFAIARAETATQDFLKALGSPAAPAVPLSNLANETVASVDVANVATAAR